MSNLQTGNTIVMYDRAKDGTLSHRREYPSGGAGSGGFEDSSNGLVLGPANREASPNNFAGAAKLLFATNAGSNTISVFRVTKDGLELVETESSGGEKPVRVTVSHGVLYVLNSGEFVDGEIAISNCTTGNLPPIAGFRVSDLALSRNNDFLYQLNSLNGKIHVYRSEHDGRLTYLQNVQAHAPSATVASLGMSAY